MSNPRREVLPVDQRLAEILNFIQDSQHDWPLFPPARLIRFTVRGKIVASGGSVVLPAYRWLAQASCPMEELQSAADGFRNYAANRACDPDVLRYLTLFALTIAASIEPAAAIELTRWIEQEHARLRRQWIGVLCGLSGSPSLSCHSE